MTNIQTSKVEKLEHGSHDGVERGLCLLEAVAYVAGEPHTDHPVCVDPVLGVFGRALNDALREDERQRLLPLISKLIGTKTDDSVSLRRAMLLVDGVVRQIVPMALEAAGLSDHAKTLRELSPVVDQTSASAASAASYASYAARTPPAPPPATPPAPPPATPPAPPATPATPATPPARLL